jgi:glucose-6-phosphate isomerase
MKQLTQLTLWKSLKEQTLLHGTEDNKHHTETLISSCGISLDFSRQHLHQRTTELLFALANERKLREKIQHLMQGKVVNLSENRPALHTALRLPDKNCIVINQRNIIEDVHFAMSEMQAIVKKIRNKQWLGHTGAPITDIVNIGVGGSDLGPRFCLQGLRDFVSPDLNFHFISTADPNAFHRVTKNLSPHNTLFIVSSKSFTTDETLYNAKKAIAWINNPAGQRQHFIAITAHPVRAYNFGFFHVLPIWSWVGGRYSFCSAINLITAIAIGWDNFQQMLDGAHSMDLHFKEADYKQNLPVMLALLGIWTNNFLNIHNVLMLVYAEPLEQFVAYVQQLDMESNGKSRDNQGNKIDYSTGPLIWGGLGNQIQHSYFQLLCQGTHRVALDFITLDTYNGHMINNMCTAKIDVLSKGINDSQNPNGLISGKMPINHLRLKDCSPFTLGALIALYEHKIFTQSVIWDINPFDQPGVESAKRFRSMAELE